MISEKKLITCKNALEKSLLIVYPTDTLYGIGADVFNKQAIEKVFLIKKRPKEMPLPIAVASIDYLTKIARLNMVSKKIISHFLPGSLTIVVKQKNLPSWIISKKDTIAIRIPNDPIALQLLEKTGPLTVTSANIHHMPTPAMIKDIRKMFKPDDIAEYIDDGIRAGMPSTIIDCTSETPKLLRKGSISMDEINSVVSLK